MPPLLTQTPEKGGQGQWQITASNYYLKLKENFFDSDSIVLLEDMKDGILYPQYPLEAVLKIAEKRREVCSYDAALDLPHSADDSDGPATR